MKRSFHGGMKRKVLVGISAALVGLTPVMAQAANKLIVKDSTGTVDKMVVTDQGYIGVGTNSPFTSMNLVGSTNAAAQILTHTNFTGSDGGGSFVGLHNNAGGGLPLSGDRLGYFYFGTKSGANYRLGGGMSVYADGPWTDTSLPTAFKFETASATTGTTVSPRVERMRITSTGNVGIGTNVPKQVLEVNGGIRMNNTANSIKAKSSKPACDNTTGPTTDGGVLWFTAGASGIKDTLEVCAKDANNNYAWRTIY